MIKTFLRRVLPRLSVLLILCLLSPEAGERGPSPTAL